MSINFDERRLKNLLSEALEYGRASRRSLLGVAAAALGATALSGLVNVASADDVPPAGKGKKVRVGMPLTYGPFNQPWRRGCWQVVKTVLENGGEVVTIRGEPTKQSEQSAERSLLDRGIDVLVMGIYSNESESAYIAEDAHKRGIKTVGFAVPVKDSPGVVEDPWNTATVLGYFVQNYLGRQGHLAQTAEARGFYAGFDMEVDLLDLMTKYQPRMKMLPFVGGGVSTQDEISQGRQNMLSLLQAHPEPGSIAGFVSWWWPFTVGAGQALKQLGRTDVPLFNHYFSDQLLDVMANKAMPIVFSTDTPWHLIGKKTAELALALGRGENVANNVYQAPVTAITLDEAPKALAELQEMDKQAIALLKQYGG